MIPRYAVYAVFVVFVASAFWYTYHLGYSSAMGDQKQAVIDQLKERSKIDEEIRNLDISGLCRSLGGVWNDGECE